MLTNWAYPPGTPEGPVEALPHFRVKLKHRDRPTAVCLGRGGTPEQAAQRVIDYGLGAAESVEPIAPSTFAFPKRPEATS